MKNPPHYQAMKEFSTPSAEIYNFSTPSGRSSKIFRPPSVEVNQGFCHSFGTLSHDVIYDVRGMPGMSNDVTGMSGMSHNLTEMPGMSSNIRGECYMAMMTIRQVCQ